MEDFSYLWNEPADSAGEDFSYLWGSTPAPQETTEKQGSGLFRGAADIGLSFGQGATGAVKALTDLAGAGNAVSRGLGNAGDYMGGLKSEDSKATLQSSRERIRAAEETGSTWEEAKAYMGMVFDQPGEMIAQGVGSFATLGFGKAAQALKLAQSAKAAGVSKAAFLANPANSKAILDAAEFGFKANIGVGAGMGVGAVKGSQYDQTFDNAKAQGMGDEEATTLATEAQAYGGAGTGQQLLGGGLGLLATATGPIERVLMGKGAREAGQGLAMGMAKGGSVELLTEGAQGAQERYAGNVAAIDAGVLAPEKRMRGVVGQGLMEGSIGMVLGGAAGAFDTQAAAPPQIDPAQRARADAEIQRQQQEAAQAAQKRADRDTAMAQNPFDEAFKARFAEEDKARLKVENEQYKAAVTNAATTSYTEALKENPTLTFAEHEKNVKASIPKPQPKDVGVAYNEFIDQQLLAPQGGLTRTAPAVTPTPMPTASETAQNIVKVKQGWDKMLAEGKVTKQQHADKMAELRVLETPAPVATAPAPTPKAAPALTPTQNMQARLDKHLAAEEITDVQHQDLTSSMESYGGKNRGRMLAKMDKEIKDAVQERSAAPVLPGEQAQGGQPIGVGQIIGGAQAPGQGEAQATSQAQVTLPEAKVAAPAPKSARRQQIEAAAKAKVVPVEKDALTAFESKLPTEQKAVFGLIRTAIENNEMDKYIQADGAWNAQAIAEASGFKARGNVTSAVKQLQAKLNAAAGRDVKAALAASVKAKRSTEGSDFERLGLSPAQQVSTASEADYLGGEGVDQSMGIISSPGGSQGATSADVTGPMTQKDRAVEMQARQIVREGGAQAPAEITLGVPNEAAIEAAIEAARQSKVTAIVAGMRNKDINRAIAAWNDVATKIDGLDSIPTDLSTIEMNDQTLDALNEVLGAYQQVVEDESLAMEVRKSFDTEGAYESAFRDVIRTRTLNAAKLGADARVAESRVLEAEPAVSTETEPAGKQPARAVTVTKKKTRVVEAKPAEKRASLEDRDALYRLAVEKVTARGRASVPLLQRELHMSNNLPRAKRLVAQMEKDGVIGPANKQGTHEVLQTVKLSEPTAVEKPVSAAQRTSEAVKNRWPNEEINLKVKLLVDALNQMGVETNLSGDLYGRGVVFVDLNTPAGSMTGIDLPRGWKITGNTVRELEAAHGLPKDPKEGPDTGWVNTKDPVVRISRLDNRPITAPETAEIVSSISAWFDKKQSPTPLKDTNFSEPTAVENQHTKATLDNFLGGLFRSSERLNRVVTVYDTQAEAAAKNPGDKQLSQVKKRIGGFKTEDGKVGLIAEHISQGTELGITLHEIGVHLGMEKLIGKANMKWLQDRVVAWSKLNDGSVENLAAIAAVRRAEASSSANKAEELIAYMVEELVTNHGVNPQAFGTSNIDQWFRRMFAAMKIALRKIGFKRTDFTGQNLIDLAYGAAELEMSDSVGWHGTAAEFRKFDHAYMGAGEGNQSFGWGTYLAQRIGIAKTYLEQDVRRKTPRKDWALETLKRELADLLARDVVDEARVADTKFQIALQETIHDRQPPEGSLMRVAANVQPDEMLDWDKPLSEQSAKVKAALEKVRREVQKAGVLYDYLDHLNTDWDGMTGQELYQKILSKAHEDGVAAISDFDRGDFSDYQEAASKYLDSIGIKGIKFLDQPSRGGQPIRSSKYLEADVAKNAGLVAAQEKKLAKYKSDGEPDYRIKAEESLLKTLVENFDSRKKDLAAAIEAEKIPKTNNLVIFNDKNLVRIKTHPGADQESIKFSESAKAEGTSTKRFKTWDTFQAALPHIERTHDVTDMKKQTDLSWLITTKARKPKQSQGTNYSEVAPQTAAAAERLGGSVLAQAVTDVSHYLKIAATSLEGLHDVVARVKKTLPSVTDWFKGVMDMKAARIAIERRADAVVALASTLDQASYKRANAFIEKATTEQKWYHQPKWLGRTVTVDPDMAAAWGKLTPKEQSVVDGVFKFGEESRTEMSALFKKLGINDVFTQLGKIEGPYAPLKRFGGFVGLLKSQTLLDAEAAVKESATTANLALVEKLKKDSAHFVAKTFFTLGQAKTFADQNAGKYATADAFTASDQLADKSSVGYKQLQKVMAAVDANIDHLPDSAKESMRQMVKDIYMTTVDQTSARQSGQKRRGVAGYDANMIHSFATHARSHAAFVASVAHGTEINSAFYKMQEEAKENKHAGADDFNLIARHYSSMMQYDPSPLSDAITAGTTVTMLSTNLSYHVQNFSQGVMKSVPKLAADFNDYPGAWKHIFAGYSLMGKISKYGQNPDLSLVRDAGLRAALTYAADQGMLDVGIEEDLSHFGRAQTGYVMVDGASQLVGTVLHKLRQVARTVESWNRVSSGAAAYTMSIANGRTHEQAQQYVMDMLTMTQGDVSRATAPLLLKKMPRVMAQYKRFQFMSAAMYTKAIYQAFKGASPEERAIGRRMTGFLLAHTSVAGGVLALPLMNLASLAFGMFGGDDDDDDDPEDMDTVIRRHLGEGVVSDFILDGAPKALLGIDMSAKLSDRNLFSIAPYTDFDFTSKAGLISTVAGVAGGPALSQASRMADGVGLIEQGQLYKGVEKLLPKGLTSAMQAFRQANDGVTLKNGDVIIQPEDLSAYALALSAVGMPSAQMREITRNQTVQYDVRKFYTDKTNDITRQYVAAAREGDDAAMADLRERWTAMQHSKDNVRYLFNDVPQELKKQSLSSLRKAVQNARKRQRLEQRVAAGAGQ